MDADKDKEETTKQVVDEKDNGASENAENAEQALFDQPLVQKGKRKRKSTELFSFQANKRGTEYTGGKGVRLGDIPFIEHSIARLKSDQLKALYRLCFDKAGTKSEIKRNLRDFNGFPSSDVIERKRIALEKMYVPALKALCEMLGVETTGKKEDLVTRLVEFLNIPVDLGKVPKKRKSSSGSSRSRKKSKPSESDDEKEELEDDVMEGEEEKEGEENDDSVMDTSQATSANGDTTAMSDDKVTKEPVKKEESKKEDEEVENKGEPVKEQEDSKEDETKDSKEAETKEENTPSSQEVAGDKVVPVSTDSASTTADTGKEE